MSPRAKSGKKVLTGQTLSVGEPLVEAARHLLPLRFEGLQRAVAESLGSQTDDPEPIHRLRVASRRCATAIELLGVLIPRDLRRPLLRDLKKLRRDCGPARDLDIQRAFYERLLGEVETQDLAVVDLLYERVSTHREKRQNQLIKGIEKRCRKLDRGCADVLAHLDLLRDRNPDPCGTLGETALPLLSGLLQRVCDLAPPSDASATQLHRLRIAGKKLRYACELFEPLLGPDYTRHLAPHLDNNTTPKWRVSTWRNCDAVGSENATIPVGNANRRGCFLGESSRRVCSSWPVFMPSGRPLPESSFSNCGPVSRRRNSDNHSKPD
jgi:CHAD domain-containing protein